MHAIYGYIHCSPIRELSNMNFSKSAIKGGGGFWEGSYDEFSNISYSKRAMMHRN